MTYRGTSDPAQWHAELIRLEAELRQVADAIAWAERSGEPRRAAALRRAAGRLRRRVARLRGLLQIPSREEGA